MAIERPLPKITPLDAPFWAHARENVLAIQYCDACGDGHFPPLPVCPKCLGPDQSWRPVSGDARLESWVVFHHGYWDGLKEALPYMVCLVELAEGPIFLSNLVGDQSEARHGAPLRVTFEKITDEITLPQFAICADS